MNSNFTDHAPIPANNLLTRIQWVLRDPSCSAEARLKRVDSLVSAASLNHVTESQHRARAGRASCKGGLAPWQIKRLHAFIAEGLSNSIRSLDLARLVGLSPHHFCRAFRVSLEVTPHAYIVRRRIEKACFLMETSPMPLGQIAIECGFADQAHFNRTFRKHLDCSPGAWRRMQALIP